ncbi:MAG: hypothetical protein FWH36_06980 [Lentimicrobiaceae bacterium]|nr:hypothetical protein [Lentimicrobiaceae bacterium]
MQEITNNIKRHCGLNPQSPVNNKEIAGQARNDGNGGEDNKKEKKIVKKIALISCAVVLFFFAVAVVFAFVFEKKIAEVVLNQLYKQTTAEIKHKDISFSLIRKFPMASLQINHLEVNESDVQADMIFLQFSILDMFRENYTIRKIRIENANLHLIVDKDGKNNWDIFVTDTSQTKPVAVELKAIQLRNVDVHFEHHRQKLEVKTHIDNLSAKGNFYNRVFTTNLTTELKIKYIQSDTTKYLVDKSVKLRTELEIDAEKNIYQIQNGAVEFERIKCNAQAKLQQKAENYDLDAKIKFDNVDVVKILKEMPPSVQQKINRYKPAASLSGNISVNSSFGKNYKLSIGGDFACKNGSIQNTENDISISNTSLKGSFSTQFPRPIPQTKIHIEAFSANLNKGTIEGRFSLENFESPSLDLNLKADIKLEDWQQFFPKNYLYKTAGQAVIDLSFANHFSQTDHLAARDFANANMSGKVVFTDAFLQMKEDENPYENLSGEVTLNDNILYANNLAGELKGNSFELNGSIENLIPYLLNDNENLKITANILLPYLDLDKLLAQKSSSAQKQKQPDKKELVLPNQIDFNLAFKAKQIKYQHFEAQNAAGNLVWSKKTLTMNGLQLNSCGGKIHADGSLYAKSNKTFALKCKAQIHQADMQKTFYAFGNFGQNQLTDKHIRGIADCDVQFSAILENNMKLIPHSIVSQIAVKINNGQLLDFKPMESLSKFLSLSELQNIRFETLENQLTIENSTIYIPAMDIKNNAINLTISGKQNFDGDIDYHLKMLLKEILSKKIKAQKQNTEDFGEIIDDNTGNTYLHLTATGNISNPKFKWDAKSTQKGIKEQFSTQKQEIQTNRQTVNPEKEKQKSEDKELNNSQKKQKEIEIDEDW